MYLKDFSFQHQTYDSCLIIGLGDLHDSILPPILYCFPHVSTELS